MIIRISQYQSKTIKSAGFETRTNTTSQFKGNLQLKSVSLKLVFENKSSFKIDSVYI